MTKRAKVPGPDHPITIERNPARVVVVVAGRIIVDTCDAVTLREASYAAVQYVARVDAIEERHEACEERLEVSGGSND